MLYSSRYLSTRGVLWRLKCTKFIFSPGCTQDACWELPTLSSPLGPPGQGGWQDERLPQVPQTFAPCNSKTKSKDPFTVGSVMKLWTEPRTKLHIRPLFIPPSNYETACHLARSLTECVVTNPAMHPRHSSCVPHVFVGYKVSAASEQVHTACYDGRDF